MARPPIAAQVAQDIGRASWIRAMFERGRTLKAKFGADNVFDFALGNPDGVPPQAFFDALRAVASEAAPAMHRYMPNAGFDESRAAVAGFISREYRIPLSGPDVILTCGAAGGLNTVMRAICDPGDEVLVLAPYFPEYRSYIQQANGRMVLVETDANFQPDAREIAAAMTPRTRALIVNSPNNPTGAVYSAEACQSIAQTLSERDSDDQPIYLITDDPYRRLLFDREWCPTPVPHYARSVIVSSYSKDLSLAGERLGYIGVPHSAPGRDQLLNALTMLNRTLGYVNAPALMQRVVARCADALCNVSEYKRKRDLLCDVLRGAGLDFALPGGGMFVFPRTPIPDDVKFVDLLQEQRVLAVPGQGFGRAGHIRISIAVPTETILGSRPGFAAAVAAARSL